MCDFDFLCVVVDLALRERFNKIMASGYFTTSPEMKAPVEVAIGREVKIRERREMGENRNDFEIYYFIVEKYYFNVLYCKIKIGMLRVL